MRNAERTILNDLAGSTDEGDKTEEGEPPKKKRSAEKENIVTKVMLRQRERESH